MKNKQHVVICGYSLFLDAIAQGLQHEPRLAVTQLHARPGLAQRAVALAPDVLIVEHGTRQWKNLLHLASHLPIIEADPKETALTVRAPRQVQLGGVSDLVCVIEQVTREKSFNAEARR